MLDFWPQISVGFFIVIALFCISWICNTRYEAVRKRIQKKGIEQLMQLRLLLAAIQQHRGLTNGFLNGDTSLQPAISKLQKKVSRYFSDLDGASSWYQSEPRWLSIREQWTALAKNYAQGESTQKLQQHNLLIDNLLYGIEDCADRHQLGRGLSGAADIHYLWQELLPAAEFIGQARAIGTGAAAAGQCSSVNRVKLRYLHSRISDISTRFNRATEEPLRRLLLCLDREFLNSHPIISASDYFALASSALETVLAEFDRQLASLKNSHGFPQPTN